MKFWAAEDRPVYKIGENPKMLTDTDLLTILLGESVENNEVARKLLFDNNNDLTKVFALSTEELMRYDGIGKVGAARIVAAGELSIRTKKVVSNELLTPTAVWKYMSSKLSLLKNEEFWVIFLNNRYKVLKCKRFFTGGLTEVCVDIRPILKEALLLNATQMFAVHNHPSGNLQPSKVDNKITRKIFEACNTLNLRLADHVIFTENNYYSYKENGIL
mgnify:CR=1 FL=1